MAKVRLSIRLKLLALSLFLMSVPWLGYQYVWEMESFLRLGQEKTLVGTAKAVATALHERPLLFDQHASYQQRVEQGKDLYAYPANGPIRLDGKLSDWLNFQQRAVFYDASYKLEKFEVRSNSDLSFEHSVNQFQDFLYLSFKVTDDAVIFRNHQSLSIDKNDYLEIAIKTKDDALKRYIFAATKTGWVNGYEVDSNNRAGTPEKRIQGYWLVTPTGYNLELRLPIEWVGAKVGFAIYDTDHHASLPDYAIGTADTRLVDNLGTVLVPSPEIDAIIKALSYSNSRIWVVDKHGRMLAKAGELISVIPDNSVIKIDLFESPFKWLTTQVLKPLYYQILTKPPSAFVDQLKDSFFIKNKVLDIALQGQSGTQWQLTPDNKAVILSASHPIFIDGEVLGAVIVEETTNGIRTLRNQALESLFNQMLLILSIGTLVFALFASRISSRITTLKKQLESAVDEQGKILNSVEPSTTNDEIGDLSHSFNRLISRLSQYNRYLEGMSSRISHEFKTPVAIIRSSLENLKNEQDRGEQNVYFSRAMDGVHRLDFMMNAMSEATRVEQTVNTDDKEEFDLAEVVSGCVSGHRIAFNQVEFVCHVETAEYPIFGNPDLIVQMLEKLLSNAIDFSDEAKKVEVSLAKKQTKFELKVSNIGTELPQVMQEDLFDSMVSIRHTDSAKPHLGLGLYIARLIAQYHKAHISIKNRNDGYKGVCVTCLFEGD
ncbi:hypothetical protein XM47_01950 [Catenovulum maritimum]|uniref:histidine kinase n=2 Tax=Catenovulum maritimum TaxID=1513271 RepID=A0A0J8GW94_9ALTE|nr:hypothetical protein XM47_01950 [Catenovulum maritimum]